MSVAEKVFFGPLDSFVQIFGDFSTVQIGVERDAKVVSKANNVVSRRVFGGYR